MRRCLLIPGVAALVLMGVRLDAQKLTVKSATAKAVELEWTGGSSAASLERSSAQGFAKVASGETGHFTDAAVDAFGTYKYRINTGGKFSNEVTVGPPPAGVSNASAAPAGSQYEKYGAATAVALDENGDPAIAFEWNDPNGDGDAADTEIRFVRWDRAAYQWTASVRVMTTGAIEDQGVHPIALAVDRSSGTFAIFTPVGDGLAYALSTDRGAAWKSAAVTNTTGTPRSAAMQIESGQVQIAVNGEDSAVYLTGPVADESAWKSQPVPAGAGWKVRNHANVALVVDAGGKPALAYYEDQQEGDGHRYVMWRPGQSEPVAINTGGTTDTADIALSYGASKFGSLFATQLDDKDADHTVWFSQSSDGSTWSKPVKLPVDGPRSTNPPLSLAIDSKGAITAGFGSNSGTAGATCNAPVISRSADGSSWKTCGLGRAAGADFGAQPATIQLIEAPDDRAYVVWQEPGETKYKPGVLVWRGR